MSKVRMRRKRYDPSGIGRRALLHIFLMLRWRVRGETVLGDSWFEGLLLLNESEFLGIFPVEFTKSCSIVRTRFIRSTLPRTHPFLIRTECFCYLLLSPTSH